MSKLLYILFTKLYPAAAAMFLLLLTVKRGFGWWVESIFLEQLLKAC